MARSVSRNRGNSMHGGTKALTEKRTKGRLIQLTCVGLFASLVAFLFVASLEALLDGREIPPDDGVLSPMPCFVSNCHQTNSSTFNSGGSVTFNNLPNSFVPGQTYDIGVTITGGIVYGLQVATVFSDNTQAGTLIPVTSGVTVHSPPDANGVQFLVHSLKPLNTGTVNFRWTAPTNPKEPNVVFKVASNSANNNVSPTGDKINTLQATVPQQAEPVLTEKLYFAQFADGGGLISQITFLNLSSTEAVNGKIQMFNDNGSPLLVDLNGSAVTELDFAIAAAASTIFKTDGVGDVQVGSVIVSSDKPLAGVILFAGSGLGVAGVGSSQALQSFLAPMDMNVQEEILTGIAIMNLESTTQTLQVELLDLEGNVVTTGTLGAGPLPGNGHIARFLNQADFQFQGSPDVSNFQGTLRVTSSGGQIAATVIRQSPGEFATLPVAQAQ